MSFNSLLADDAPICVTHGGNVKPIENNDIQMYSETIDITLLPTHYEVEVNYVFKNHGSEQEVVLGFPSSSRFDMSFKAFDGKTELEISKMKSDWVFKPENGMSCQYISNPIDQFECHTVLFNAGETKNIRNTYKQMYDPAYRDGPQTSFYYIVTTGAFWKDEITSIEIRVHTENAPLHFDLENGLVNKEKTSIINYYDKIENIEPTEDLYFGINYKNYLTPWGATSILNSSGKIDYGISNLDDKSIKTAWVEGESESGIGTIIKYKNPSRKANTINGIEIINGYAKNYNTFIENNRVAFLKVSVINKLYNEDLMDSEFWDIKEFFNGKYKTKEEYLFTLEDTPYVQYLEFDSPIKAKEIEFEILKVYKGTKYDDTAISEIHICENGARYKGETSNIPVDLIELKE